MKRSLVRRSVIAGLAVVALLGLIVPIAKLASTESGVLEACVNPGNGNMRLVSSTTACHNNETRVSWNVTGPEGPPGPPGPSSGGPPFTWICAPAYFPQSGSNTRADLYVYNGSTSAANVSVNILDRDGNNLQGQTIPGSAQTYPGEANGSTVAVTPTHTRILNWVTPQNDGNPGANVSVSVRVISDQPVVVASHFEFNPQGMPNVCHLVP